MPFDLAYSTDATTRQGTTAVHARIHCKKWHIEGTSIRMAVLSFGFGCLLFYFRLCMTKMCCFFLWALTPSNPRLRLFVCEGGFVRDCGSVRDCGRSAHFHQHQPSYNTTQCLSVLSVYPPVYVLIDGSTVSPLLLTLFFLHK